MKTRMMTTKKMKKRIRKTLKKIRTMMMTLMSVRMYKEMNQLLNHKKKMRGGGLCAHSDSSSMFPSINSYDLSD